MKSIALFLGYILVVILALLVIFYVDHAYAMDEGQIPSFSLVSGTPGSINATWSSPDVSPTDYRISWAKDSEHYKTWTDLSGNAFPKTTAFSLSGLEADQRYKLRLRARYFNKGDTSPQWSGPWIERKITVLAPEPVPTSTPKPTKSVPVTPEKLIRNVSVDETISITPQYDTVTGKADWLLFDLERTGNVDDVLSVNVLLTGFSGNDWDLSLSKMSQTVTFDSGSSTSTAIFRTQSYGYYDIGISDDAVKSGTITASILPVEGYDTEDTADVYIVVIDGPAWTVKLGEPHYTFVEETGIYHIDVVLKATDSRVTKPVPFNTEPDVIDISPIFISITSEADTATSPDDYVAVSEIINFPISSISRNSDGMNSAFYDYQFSITDDSIDEGVEHFELQINIGIPGLGSHVVMYETPNGSIKNGPVYWPITILDNDTKINKIEVVSSGGIHATNSWIRDTYIRLNHIDFLVTFDKPVSVKVYPYLTFELGDSTVNAYSGWGDGTNQLHYYYAIQEGDVDTDGISWQANQLYLGRGDITVLDDGSLVDLSHSAQSPMPMHKVDGRYSHPIDDPNYGPFVNYEWVFYGTMMFSEWFTESRIEDFFGRITGSGTPLRIVYDGLEYNPFWTQEWTYAGPEPYQHSFQFTWKHPVQEDLIFIDTNKLDFILHSEVWNVPEGEFIELATLSGYRHRRHTGMVVYNRDPVYLTSESWRHTFD